MNDYTYAIVIITDADRIQAQIDMGNAFFNFPLSDNGEAPATHWMSSGPFHNSEIEAIIATYSWPSKIYYGQEWQAAIEAEGLKPVTIG